MRVVHYSNPLSKAGRGTRARVVTGESPVKDEDARTRATPPTPLDSGSAPPSSGRAAGERTGLPLAGAEARRINTMSSRKVMAIQARKRRPKGKKDKTAHHRR
ncbi:hypothetical protein SRHO_G00092050 [Serrasalmus rhombeus]